MFFFNVPCPFINKRLFTLTVQIGVVLLTDELVVVPEVNSVPGLEGAVTKYAFKARFVVNATKDPSHDF